MKASVSCRYSKYFMKPFNSDTPIFVLFDAAFFLYKICSRKITHIIL